MKSKFGKIFEPEIKLQGFKFDEGKLAATGQSCRRRSSRKTAGWRSAIVRKKVIAATHTAAR